MRSASAYVVSVALLVTASLASAPGCGGSEESKFGEGTEDGGTESFGEGGAFSGDLDGSGGSANFADAACATGSALSGRLPVYMLMVLDGSGSMDGLIDSGDRYESGSREVDPLNPTRPTLSDDRDDPGTPGFTGKKWLAARGALNAFWDGLAGKPVDNTLGVGLYLFSSTAGKPSNQVDIGIAPVTAAQATQLKTRVNPNVYPDHGTPLRPAIRDQGAILKAFTPSGGLATGGKRVLVVISDGVPTSGGGRDECKEEAASLLRAGVSTFVIGVGDPRASREVYDERFLGELAVAGGTQVAGCNQGWDEGNMTGVPCHLQVTPGTKTAAQLRDEFTVAIDGIRTRVTSCEFPLQKPANVGELDPSKVNVLYTPGSGGAEKPLVQDAKDGWTYDKPAAPTKVVLHGKSCDTLKSDTNGKIRIVVGCKTETVRVN